MGKKFMEEQPAKYKSILEDARQRLIAEKGFTPEFPRQERMVGLVFGDLSWELDFFGRIRRATEAARTSAEGLYRASAGWSVITISMWLTFWSMARCLPPWAT